jgi:hypothetical protein
MGVAGSKEVHDHQGEIFSNANAIFNHLHLRRLIALTTFIEVWIWTGAKESFSITSWVCTQRFFAQHLKVTVLTLPN